MSVQRLLQTEPEKTSTLPGLCAWESRMGPSAVHWIPSRWYDSAFCLEVIFMRLDLGMPFPTSTRPLGLHVQSLRHCAALHRQERPPESPADGTKCRRCPSSFWAGPENLHFQPAPGRCRCRRSPDCTLNSQVLGHTTQKLVKCTTF